MGNMYNVNNSPGSVRSRNVKPVNKEFELIIDPSLDVIDQHGEFYSHVGFRREAGRKSPFRVAQWCWDTGCNGKFTDYDNFQILGEWDPNDYWVNKVGVSITRCKVKLTYANGREKWLFPSDREYIATETVKKLEIVPLTIKEIAKVGEFYVRIDNPVTSLKASEQLDFMLCDFGNYTGVNYIDGGMLPINDPRYGNVADHNFSLNDLLNDDIKHSERYNVYKHHTITGVIFQMINTSDKSKYTLQKLKEKGQIEYDQIICKLITSHNERGDGLPDIQVDYEDFDEAFELLYGIEPTKFNLGIH